MSKMTNCARILAFALAGSLCLPLAAREVKGAFDPQARAKEVAHVSSPVDCPEPPAAVVDIRIEEYYDKSYTKAEAAVATAVGDERLLRKGLDKYRLGVDEITDEGLLPKEVARKEKALGYHIFSLAPLVMMAEIGERNGIDLYGYRDGAIHRLVRTVAKGVADPHTFEELVGGKPQELDKRRPGWNLAWAEPYLARFPDPQAWSLGEALRLDLAVLAE